MDESKVFYEIKELNDEISELENDFNKVKHEEIDKVIYQVGKDELSQNINELRILKESIDEANNKRLLIYVSLIILSLLLMVILAIFVNIFLGIVGAVGLCALLIYMYLNVGIKKKAGILVKVFLKQHKTYYGIVADTFSSKGKIKVKVAGTPLNSYIASMNKIDIYKKNRLFYESTVMSLKDESDEKKEKFILSNKKYADSLKKNQQIVKKERLLASKKVEREEIANENSLFVEFIASQAFVDLVIEVFETNENITTKIDAIKFIAQKQKENMEWNDKLEKVSEFDELIGVAKNKLEMTYIPKFF